MSPHRAIAAMTGGLWMVGTNGTAHLFPGIVLPRAGVHSACHKWISTTEDRDEGNVTTWCPTCCDSAEIDPR